MSATREHESSPYLRHPNPQKTASDKPSPSAESNINQPKISKTTSLKRENTFQTKLFLTLTPLRFVFLVFFSSVLFLNNWFS